jgi:hypothetical protein
MRLRVILLLQRVAGPAHGGTGRSDAHAACLISYPHTAVPGGVLRHHGGHEVRLAPSLPATDAIDAIDAIDVIDATRVRAICHPRLRALPGAGG